MQGISCSLDRQVGGAGMYPSRLFFQTLATAAALIVPFASYADCWCEWSNGVLQPMWEQRSAAADVCQFA
jgi:hypothetical protein